MSDLLEYGKISTKGFFNLALGSIVSISISAVGYILIARLLGPDSYGLYQVVLVPSLLFILFGGLGVNPALVRYIAHFRAQGKNSEVSTYMWTGTLIIVISGIPLFLTLFLFSDYIALQFFHRPEAGFLMRISSITVIANLLYEGLLAIFRGFEKMRYQALLQSMFSIVRTCLILVLILFGLEVFGAITGYTMSYLIILLLGLLIIFKYIYSPISLSKDKFVKTAKNILHYSIPLYFAGICGGLRLIHYIGLLLAIFCSNIEIGNYYAASNFATLIAFEAYPIVCVIFPAFSKINYETEIEKVRSAYNASIRYTSLLIVPTVFYLMILAEPIVSFFYGTEYHLAPLYLSLYSISFLVVGLGFYSVEPLLNAQGHTWTTFKLNFIPLMLAIPLYYVTLLLGGIICLLIAICIVRLVFAVYGYVLIKSKLKPNINWFSVAKIYASAIIAGASTYVTVLSIHTIFPSALVDLGIGLSIFILTYLLIIPLLGAIDKSDIFTLKNIFEEIRIVGLIFKAFLCFEERIINIKLKIG